MKNFANGRTLPKIKTVIFLSALLVLATDLQAQIAHWRFNGNGNDDLGLHNITAQNSSMYVSSTSVEGTHVVSFNGADYYFNYGSIDLGSQFTITGWFKTWNELPQDQ